MAFHISHQFLFPQEGEQYNGKPDDDSTTDTGQLATKTSPLRAHSTTAEEGAGDKFLQEV